ncbi:hypothetical protein V2J09_015375 [Rumex salicifolius]
MGDSVRSNPGERDIDQAITALKKGATLLKYGRRGRPKFSPFRLSNDESSLIWYSGKEERQIKLSQVLRIIPGQRTATFQRYPRPEKEYQSFSLICNDRSLDLICKDKEEAEVWFIGLKALISNVGSRKWRSENKDSISSSDTPPNARKFFQSFASSDPGELLTAELQPQAGLGKAHSDLILYSGPSRSQSLPETGGNSLSSPPTSLDNCNNRSSASDIRVSLSSVVSSSSQGSCYEDFDSLGDVFLWGEGLGEGVLGGGNQRIGCSSSLNRIDALLPKGLESTVVLDVQHVSCGGRHAALVTKQGEIFSWGEESGGRLGHGIEVDVPHPKLINTITGMNVELVACGEYHTCAVTVSGELLTWGDSTRSSGLLGHGSEASHWVPKKVGGLIDGLHVTYVSCGPWHTAVLSSSGQLFTFGDGTFGALGHGDRTSVRKPKQVEALVGLRTVKVACGGWHTAAVVEIMTEDSVIDSIDRSWSGKLFTWGDGDNGQLGHGDKEARFIPQCVVSIEDLSFSGVACGRDFTLGLTISGRVYAMGSSKYGQLGRSEGDGMFPMRVEGKIASSFIEEAACGSHHVAVLTSKAEVYTWGRGTNGQLGHGDVDHRKEPTLVDFFKDKQVKSVACGSNFTAVICLHKWLTSVDHSACTACHNPFNFRRKRHNCYNCGLVFCKACSSRKSLKASLAPSMTKPYRVCDDCYAKLKKSVDPGQPLKIPRPASRNNIQKSSESSLDKETPGSKLAGHLSRLSFVDLRKSDGGSSKSSVKLEKCDSGSSLVGSENNWTGFQPSASPPPQYGTRVSASAPGSRMVSRSSSPISFKPKAAASALSIPSLSLTASPEFTRDGSLFVNCSAGQEIIDLRTQVERLSRKIQSLESDLEKASRQLMEARAVAADEAENSKAANEIIRSLTAQLKEMTERVPNAYNDANLASDNISLATLVVPPKSDQTTLAHGTKQQTEKSEWVIQDEQGVYVTLSSLTGGGTELKRVRFSRKRFSEEQAEKWWNEHSSSICERYNIQKQ